MNPVKRMIVRGLYEVGLELKWLPRQVNGSPAPFTPYLPIDILDLVIERERARVDDWFFIQIGAHDGVSVDPVRNYITKYNWKGILVEPQPKIFARLAKACEGNANLKLENAAVGTKDGTASLYAFKEDSRLPYHATMLASFNRDALVHNGHAYVGEIEEIKVPTISVRTLLEKHAVKHVNLLQIDTEGFDKEIIRFFIQSNCFPTIIHFEDGVGTQQENPILRTLNDLGYGVFHFYPDTLAYRAKDTEEFRRRVMATQQDLNEIKPVYAA